MKYVVAGIVSRFNPMGDMEYVFVLGEKDYGEGFNGNWGFPAGHIEEGETPEQAVIRELKEELDIEVAPIKTIAEGLADLPNYYAYWIMCNWESGDINPSKREIKDLKWLTKEEALKLQLWPATIPVIKKYL